MAATPKHGTWPASQPPPFSFSVAAVPPPTVNLAVTGLQSGTAYWAGDSYVLTVAGPPNSAVSVVQNGGNPWTFGTMPCSGAWSTSGSWTAAAAANYTQTWYVGGVAATPALSFSVVAPTVTSLSPASGGVGTPVTITGTNFGATQPSGATVSFNGVQATPTTWNNSTIVATVPPGAGSGNVLVTVNGQTGGGPIFAFPPVITGLSTRSGKPGTYVTITGTAFGATQGNSTVTFGGMAATAITSWIPTQIVAAVPQNASGNVSVVVSVSGFQSNGLAFAIPLTITTVSPTSGPVSTSITISGSGFGTATGTLTVGGVAVDPTSVSWGPTTITAAVPASLALGAAQVVVNGVTSATPYTVTPGIGSISMSAGPVQMGITITGTTFTLDPNHPGNNYVSFNGTPVPATQATSWVAGTPPSVPGTITVQVPAGATTGNLTVVASGSVSNAVPFKVLTSFVCNP